MIGEFNGVEDKDCYRFSYNSDTGDRNFNATLYLDFDTTWDTVLISFLDFLSGIYGYDIKDRVDIKENPVFQNFPEARE